MKLPFPSEAMRARVSAFAAANTEALGALAIFALALAARLPLVHIGLPYAAHPDEAQLLHRGIQMLKSGDLNPGYFNYPSFPMYVHAVVAITSFLGLIREGVVQSLPQIDTMLDTGFKWQRVPELFLLRGREVSVLLGSLGIVGGYLSVSRLFGVRPALVAGVIAALSVLHVNATRYIATDAFATCFTSFTVLACIEIWRRGRLGDYALAGVLAGLSAASKYNAGAIVLIAVFAHVLRDDTDESGTRGHVGPLALLFAATGVTFIATNPYTLLDLPTFIDGLAGEIRHYAQGDSYGPANVQPGLPHLFRIFTFLSSTDGMNVWTVFALAGPWLGRRYGWRRWALLLSYPALATALLVGQSVFFPRNLILLVPWVAGSAAVTLLAIVDAVRARAGIHATAATWVTGLLLAAPAAMAVAWIVPEAARADSRNEVVAYARTQLPPGSVVAIPDEMDLVLGDWPKDESAPRIEGVRLADLTAATLVESGVTHAILSDRLAYSGGFGGLTGRKVELLDEGVAALPPVFVTGGGLYTLGANMLAPRLGVYRLDDPTAVAAADAKFTVPAADPVWGYVSNGGFEDELIGSVPPGFMLIPPTEADGAIVEDPERGRVYRINAKPSANPSMVCMSSEVALGGPLALSGWWRSEDLDPGARAQVRFWNKGALATIREAASINGKQDWTAFRGVVDVPEGVKRTKICIFVQSDKGALWLDDLSLAPAGAAELGGPPVTTAASDGPALPGAWSAVPPGLRADGRAGPEGDDGFFVVGRPTGESLVCDDTPRPVKDNAVTIHAKMSVSDLPPGTPPGQAPRLQIRGMVGPGGTAARIDDTLQVAANGAAADYAGTATMPPNVTHWKVCAVVRTPGTRLTVTGFGTD